MLLIFKQFFLFSKNEHSQHATYVCFLHYLFEKENVPLNFLQVFPLFVAVFLKQFVYFEQNQAIFYAENWISNENFKSFEKLKNKLRNCT